MKKLLAPLSLIAALAASGPTLADTIAGHAWRSANDSSPGTNVFKPLNDAGSTALPFKTTVANDPIRVIFNAECGVLGPSEAWVSVTILIDGVEANPPDSTDFAFCSATSQSSFTWVGATRQSFAKVATAGLHYVQVKVNLVNGATSWWLGNSSIGVEAN